MKSSKKAPRIKTKRAPRQARSYPRDSKDAFVSQKMLYSVRDELIAHTEKKFQQTEVRFNELQSEIHSVKAEIQDVRSEVHAVKAEIQELRSELHALKAEIHEVKAAVAQLEKTVHRMALLVEEQNNRNKIVLDGLAQLFERQERIEKKIDTRI